MCVPEGPRLFVAPQPEMLGIPRHGSEASAACSASHQRFDLGYRQSRQSPLEQETETNRGSFFWGAPWLANSQTALANTVQARGEAVIMCAAKPGGRPAAC